VWKCVIVPGEGVKVRGSSALMRHSMETDLVLAHGKPAARCHANLLVHQIDAGDGFGHRMLHLQAGVHLDEVELAVFVEKLDRPGAGIAHVGDRGCDDRPDSLALLGVEGRRVGLFPDLLVTSLQRAVALAKMDGTALAVTDHLHFDVARLFQILLDIDGIVPKGSARFRTRGRQRHHEVGPGARHLHAAPTAASGGLDDDRVADLVGDADRIALFRHRAFRTGHDRDAQPLCSALGLDLVAHDADVVARRSDEGDVVGGQDVGELGVLGQEAIARVDRVGAGDLARSNDLMDVQIGIARRRRPDAHALVRKAYMHRVRVGG
jgi:hypothetical protein